jgi:hypothetical protein
MPNYIVRVAGNHDLVGVYSVSCLRDLPHLIDEICDPNACEYAVVSEPWGVAFPDKSVPIRQTVDVEPDMKGASFTEAIFYRMYRKWSPVPKIEY